MVPQEFAKTKRVDRDFLGASPHGGCDFPAQELGGGTGEEEFVTRGVEKTTDKLFPAGNTLDFIQEKGEGLIGGLGKEAQMSVRDEVELSGLHVTQTLVLEIKIEQTTRAATRSDQGAALVKETGFPARRIPMTAAAFPLSGGSVASRLVSTGMPASTEARILFWMIWLSWSAIEALISRNWT
jgi:hypothetical protein